MILCYGPRRLRTNPVYSQLTRGGGKGANNVHKFERWLRHSVTSVATIYGPVAFGNQPCMLLRETGDPQGMHLWHVLDEFWLVFGLILPFACLRCP